MAAIRPALSSIDQVVVTAVGAGGEEGDGSDVDHGRYALEELSPLSKLIDHATGQVYRFG
jgi:hypothetical protein